MTLRFKLQTLRSLFLTVLNLTVHVDQQTVYSFECVVAHLVMCFLRFSCNFPVTFSLLFVLLYLGSLSAGNAIRGGRCKFFTQFTLQLSLGWSPFRSVPHLLLLHFCLLLCIYWLRGCCRSGRKWGRQGLLDDIFHATYDTVLWGIHAEAALHLLFVLL